MKLQRTFQGLEIELRSVGRGRFGGAAFLTLWLLFWIVGESMALLFLARGAWSLVTGAPLFSNGQPATLAASLVGGSFLLLWTSLWTFGGIFAGREWLRLLFGRDRLVARPGGLDIVNSHGLFRTRRNLTSDQLIRFYVPRSSPKLMVETREGGVTLSRFDRPDQLAEIVQALNDLYRLPAETAVALLPRTWRELSTAEGRTVLIHDPVNRRRLGLVVWTLFVLLAGVTAVLAVSAVTGQPYAVIAAIFATLASLAGWGAWRLSTHRDEWVLQRGALALEHRSRSGIKRIFAASRIRLRESRDSDGDPWFTLVAAQDGAAGPKTEKTIDSRSGDPTELSGLGHWLAGRCHLPFEDLTTAEAKSVELEELRQKLAASGRFGAWAARLLGKSAPSGR